MFVKRNLDGTLTFKIEDSNHGLIEEKTTTQTISTSTAMKFDPIEVAQNNAPTIGYVDEIYVDDDATCNLTIENITKQVNLTINSKYEINVNRIKK